MAWRLKARIVKPAETAVARERLCKNIAPAAIKEHATMKKVLEAVFSVRSVPRLYKESVLGRQPWS
jgi:hypothetical protein